MIGQHELIVFFSFKFLIEAEINKSEQGDNMRQDDKISPICQNPTTAPVSHLHELSSGLGSAVSKLRKL